MTAVVIALAVSALLILVVAATRLVHRFEARYPSHRARLDRAVRHGSLTPDLPPQPP
ncbi:hypothetical protein [Streptomyces sp. NPDC005423]|uniref:hypothetical protein n=1 Tax=Streptomyces sp. NPDC005423 TaxID=3155343 RepID=UPI0033A97899